MKVHVLIQGDLLNIAISEAPVRQLDDQALACCYPSSKVSEADGTLIAPSGETLVVIEQKSAEAIVVDGEDGQKRRAERLDMSKAHHAR